MTILEAIKTYQVPGSIGFDENNFEQSGVGLEWSGHVAAIWQTNVGLLFLGMPKGFNRAGFLENNMKICIFYNMQHHDSVWPYDKYNIPCWKYLDEHGNTIVRGLQPRLNNPFLHVILGDVRDKINCLEITNTDLDSMD